MTDQLDQQDEKNKDNALVEIEKKIADAFDIFDHEANKTVDSREIGTIIRSLGCCPSEADLKDILALIEDEETPGYVLYDKFLPLMTQILQDNRFKAASDEELLEAFQILDVDNKGYLLKDEVTKFMTEEVIQFPQWESSDSRPFFVSGSLGTVNLAGEAFSPDEMDTMLQQAVDVETEHIFYRKYLFTLSPEDDL